MDAFKERLLTDAATIDELLSADFETLPGQKGDSDRAAQRLAAWCRSSASGDWEVFAQRLARDGWDVPGALARFATVRRRPGTPLPLWYVDALWVEETLYAGREGCRTDESWQTCAFEELWLPVVRAAEEHVWSSLPDKVANRLSSSARSDLGHMLLRRLCELCAPAVYDIFDRQRDAGSGNDYRDFIADMKARGLAQLFDAKPVLLRLIATVTRQWIDASAEFATRLNDDLPAIRTELLSGGEYDRVTHVLGSAGDLHNAGRSVLIVEFGSGARILYKPKDLGADVAWRSLVERLNASSPPLELAAVRAVARQGYGWTEFVEHVGCSDPIQVQRYFERAGAWLALFFCFAAVDLHQENVIAAGEHPVPIDIETILHPRFADEDAVDPEGRAHFDAQQIIDNSAISVGLIPSYGINPDDTTFTTGGLVSNWNRKRILQWRNINTASMRPVREWTTTNETTNLPHAQGRYANLAAFCEHFISGFEEYARFLIRLRGDQTTAELVDGFTGLVVRYVHRPTRFYSLLLNRLHDHRAMADGVIWSAQADFPARLSDWTHRDDQLWPLVRAERADLLELNIPYFTVRSDTTGIRTRFGSPVVVKGMAGLERAMARMESLDESGITLQSMVIRQSLQSLLPRRTYAPLLTDPGSRPPDAPPSELFRHETDRIADELARLAIRREPGAAWIALEWVGDAESSQLTVLGHDLYNGGAGIGVFLAAHALLTGFDESADLARAAVAHVRARIRRSDSAHFARRLGIGGATGVGSVVYALTVMARCLSDDTLLADAHQGAALITEDLIRSDARLDVIGGSAGAILALLALHRRSPQAELVASATRCGDHLLSVSRIGSVGHRTWSGAGPSQALTGMSHGAAGYAYALAQLAAVTGRQDFADAAAECIAFENATFEPQYGAWPKLDRDGQVSWPSQWCHGAPGIGLAHGAIAELDVLDGSSLATDIGRAVTAVENGWALQTCDTLCCGSLGSIEFLGAAGTALGRNELSERAFQHLASIIAAASARGDYRWITGSRAVNPGLFRGLAGVGYTALRQLDPTLPNVLLWD